MGNKKKNMNHNITFIVALILLFTYTLQDNCSENKFQGPIPKETIVKILQKFNKHRANLANGKVTCMNKRVIPKSSNMDKLYWNHALEEKAQQWANQLVKDCRFAHRPNKGLHIGKGGKPIGENIGKNVSYLKKSINNIDNAFRKTLQAWWMEKEIFDLTQYEIADKSEYEFDYRTGHFTQMAWAETTQVGCGYALFSDSRFKTNEIVVCNFAVEGNDIGRKQNLLGTPCSKCGHDLPCSKEFPGLCGDDKSIYSEKIAFHAEIAAPLIFDN